MVVLKVASLVGLMVFQMEQKKVDQWVGEMAAMLDSKKELTMAGK